MISSIRGVVDQVDGSVLTLRVGMGGAAQGQNATGLGASAPGSLDWIQTVEVYVPAFLGSLLAAKLGSTVSLQTVFYLEGQVQGTSFVPRLLGFASAADREFFDLLTEVKGIGNRKALRAMAQRPSWIASAIVRGDAKALTELPEIGKKLAETMVLELREKAKPFADSSANSGVGAGAFAAPSRGEAVRPMLSAVEQDAIGALVTMGDQPAEAERKVKLAITKLGKVPETVAELVQLSLR